MPPCYTVDLEGSPKIVLSLVSYIIMTKWTGPLAPPPSWLDPTMEVTAAMEPPKMDRGTFVVRCVQALLNEGCNGNRPLNGCSGTPGLVPF